MNCLPSEGCYMGGYGLAEQYQDLYALIFIAIGVTLIAFWIGFSELRMSVRETKMLKDWNDQCHGLSG